MEPRSFHTRGDPREAWWHCWEALCCSIWLHHSRHELFQTCHAVHDGYVHPSPVSSLYRRFKVGHRTYYPQSGRKRRTRWSRWMWRSAKATVLGRIWRSCPCVITLSCRQGLTGGGVRGLPKEQPSTTVTGRGMDQLCTRCSRDPIFSSKLDRDGGLKRQNAISFCNTMIQNWIRSPGVDRSCCDVSTLSSRYSWT